MSDPYPSGQWPAQDPSQNPGQVPPQPGQWNQQPQQGQWNQQPQQGQWGQWGQQPQQQWNQQPQPAQQWGQQPGQPNQQQWGQYGGPGGPGGPTGNGGPNLKVILAIVVGLLLIVGVVVTLVLTLGGGDDDKGDDKDGSKDGTNDGASALSVATSYVQALRDRDCEAAQALRTPNEEDCEETVPPSGDISLEDPEESSTSDERVTFNVQAKASNPATGEKVDTTIPMVVVKVDDGWKVESFGVSGQTSSSGPDSPVPSPEVTDGSDDGAVPPSSGGSGGGEPAALVDTLVAAIVANDCDAAKATLYIPEIADCDDVTLDDEQGVTFGTPTETSSTDSFASYSVPLMKGSEEAGQLTIYLLTDENGAWKVSTYTF